MVAAEIFEKFSKLQGNNFVGMEDLSDRLHSQVTFAFLLVACTTVTFKTYVLSPVACYVPNQVGAHSGQEQFVNTYCWTEGTYAVPVSEFKIDNSQSNSLQQYESRKIIYYQWVPFVLALQALLFMAPRRIWRAISQHNAGIDIHNLVRTANAAAKVDGAKHQILLEDLSRRVLVLMRKHKDIDKKDGSCLRRLKVIMKKCFILTSWNLDYWLLVTYLLMKLMYIGNGCLQLGLMHKVLGFNESHTAFGYRILSDLVRGRDWQHSMVFPRVGTCAIEVRSMAFTNFIYTQCTLPINMINEKMFVILWFWIIIITAFSVLSLPYWIWRCISISWRVKFVKSFLSDKLIDTDPRSCRRFVRDFLRLDGIFLLRMIADNSGELICTEIMSLLMDKYAKEYKDSDHAPFTQYFSLKVPPSAPSKEEAAAAEAELCVDAPFTSLRQRNVEKPWRFAEEAEIQAMDTDAPAPKC